MRPPVAQHTVLIQLLSVYRLSSGSMGGLSPSTEAQIILGKVSVVLRCHRMLLKMKQNCLLTYITFCAQLVN